MFNRRDLLALTTALAMSLATGRAGYAASPSMRRRAHPASGEEIPVIGLGTSDEFERMPPGGGKDLRAVLTTLFEHGGRLIDTAPVYGDAEIVLGQLLRELGLLEEAFLSSKVWSRGAERGRRSLQRSGERLGKQPLDLLMVHSMIDVDTQLRNLRDWKEAGHVRYIGITTSRTSGFEQMERLIRDETLDFIQVNYSPLEPQAADRVIPAAADRGVAVMVNRAFGNGSYFQRVAGMHLPEWAAEFDCESWAQFSLKYILGNRDVTCVLAATSNPAHMADNAAAGTGSMPDQATRRRIEEFLRQL